MTGRKQKAKNGLVANSRRRSRCGSERAFVSVWQPRQARQSHGAGPYTVYVALITFIGIISLHVGRPDTMMWVTALVFMALVAPPLECCINVNKAARRRNNCRLEVQEGSSKGSHRVVLAKTIRL